jgi:hypothetical protein
MSAIEKKLLALADSITLIADEYARDHLFLREIKALIIQSGIPKVVLIDLIEGVASDNLDAPVMEPGQDLKTDILKILKNAGKQPKKGTITLINYKIDLFIEGGL